MPPVLPPRLLHDAVAASSTARLVALLSSGPIDIDQRSEDGFTPLMSATILGRSRAVKILLSKGASVLEKYGDDELSALHMSASDRRDSPLDVMQMLVEAGADLEAKTTAGLTPLYLASDAGHLGRVKVLIKAGANPNNRSVAGPTPLYIAAEQGYVAVMKELLRAKADPLLGYGPNNGIPLDMAAQNGHLGAVRELVEHVGIAGCGGASGGAEALRLAAMFKYMGIMKVLKNAGAVDTTGMALITACACGNEAPVKFLLQQKKGGNSAHEAAYANTKDGGKTPVLYATGFYGFGEPSPRIIRMLIDAGADTTSAVRVTNNEGKLEFDDPPLTFVYWMLHTKKIALKAATEDQMHRLECIRRLLLRVEAVRAVSLLWPIEVSSMIGAVECKSKMVATTTSLTGMLPILRRRARRPRVLLAALFRFSGKP